MKFSQMYCLNVRILNHIILWELNNGRLGRGRFFFSRQINALAEAEMRIGQVSKQVRWKADS